MLRIPNDGDQGNRYFGVSQYKVPMRKAAADSCGGALKGVAGTSSSKPDKQLVASPEDIFDLGKPKQSEMKKSTSSTTPTSGKAIQPAVNNIPSGDSFSRLSVFSGERKPSSINEATSNPQYKRQLLDFVKQQNPVSKPKTVADLYRESNNRSGPSNGNPGTRVDRQSGLNSDGSYDTRSAGNVARKQYSDDLKAESQEIRENAEMAYTNTKAAASTEWEYIKNDLGIARKGGYFKKEVAIGAAKGVEDGSVFIADAAVNGVAGNLKKAAVIVTSPITGADT